MSNNAFPGQDLNLYESVNHDHPSTYASKQHTHGYSPVGHTHTVADSGWIAITNFLNGATAYQSALSSDWCPRYRKLNGVVFLQGLINANSTATTVTIANIPAGFRPHNSILKVNKVVGSVRRMDIFSSGDIRFSTGLNTSGWHSISAYFPADN